MFIGRRLVNKSIKKHPKYVNNFDPNQYLIAMKDFQKKTRGMSKESEEYFNIRNEVYANLREQKR